MPLHVPDTEIVQIGASHGVLEFGRHVDIFERQIPAEFVRGSQGRNLFLFEEAGGWTRDEAENFSPRLRGGETVLEQYAKLFTSKAPPHLQQVLADQEVFSALTTAPMAEHGHSKLRALFIAWIWENHASSLNLEIVPENTPDQGEKERILQVALGCIRPGILQGKKLDDLLTEFREYCIKSREVVDRRDAFIASYLQEKLARESVRAGTRRKIIISIGAGHKGIKSALDPSFQTIYRENISHDALDGMPIEEALSMVDFAREEAARIILYGLLCTNIKKAFLNEYAGTILKEPGKDAHMQTAFDAAREICESLSLETVYMFLQEIAHIDCGLERNSYPQTELPEPLSLEPQTFARKVKEFTLRFGQNNLSDSRIGLFLDRKVIEHALFIRYRTEDRRFRKVFSHFTASLSPTDLHQLKEEMVLMIQSRNTAPQTFFLSLIRRYLRGKPQGDGLAIRSLREFFGVS